MGACACIPVGRRALHRKLWLHCHLLKAGASDARACRTAAPLDPPGFRPLSEHIPVRAHPPCISVEVKQASDSDRSDRSDGSLPPPGARSIEARPPPMRPRRPTEGGQKAGAARQPSSTRLPRLGEDRNRA